MPLYLIYKTKINTWRDNPSATTQIQNSNQAWKLPKVKPTNARYSDASTSSQKSLQPPVCITHKRQIHGDAEVATTTQK
jgi:hypothetical protein